MGNILGAYLMPHPPIIISEIGRNQSKEVKSTINAMTSVAKDIAMKGPDTIIIISPHGPVFSDGIGLRLQSTFRGDFGRFGVPSLSMDFSCDEKLTKDIVVKSNIMGIKALEVDTSLYNTYNISKYLDWGVLVPLYFVKKEIKDFKLVAIGISETPLTQHYEFGKAISNAIGNQNKNVVIIASGDLSHRLKDDGPYGYHPSGKKLDKQIMTLLKEGEGKELLSINPKTIDEGGECGLRPIVMAMGAIEGKNFKSRVLSYEHPFGVGYGVASFEPGDIAKSGSLRDRPTDQYRDAINEGKSKQNKYVKLAKESLETYVLEGNILSIQGDLAKGFKEKPAGVFVTIKQNDRLRGCIGTIEPTKDSISEEIIHNAISAGTRDPRFPAIGPEELDTLSYSVDVLMEPEPINSLEKLDVKKYGVIVTKGARRGLLLPNIDGINNPLEQVNVVLQKAGISNNESYRLERFEVIRHQ